MMISSLLMGTPSEPETPTKEDLMNASKQYAATQVWDRRRLAIVLAIAVATLLVLLCAGSARAQGVVRAWGMGGASTAASRGLEAVAYNPANLAFSQGLTVGLAAGAADVRNNALSLDRYNEITGQYLDSADKAQLMSDIPATGMKLDADLSASALGYQSGSFAVSFGGYGAGRGNLDRDYFDLVLNGNQLGETVDFSNTWGEAYAVGAATFSYGHLIADFAGTRLSVGANARYLRGIYEMHVAEAYGTLTTSLNEISGEAYVATESATGGQGYGLDLGIALQTADGWQLGLAFDNVLTSINWDRDVERREMSVTAADVNLLSGDLDAAVSGANTTTASPSYTTSLPARARLGAARSFGDFLVAADWVQGIVDGGATSTQPRLNAGVEWQFSGNIQPRVGLAGGGARGASATVGIGLQVGPLQVDAAAIARDGVVPGNSKGLGLALGSQLQF